MKIQKILTFLCILIVCGFKDSHAMENPGQQPPAQQAQPGANTNGQPNPTQNHTHEDAIINSQNSNESDSDMSLTDIDDNVLTAEDDKNIKNTELHLAVLKRQKESITLLLSQNVDVNAKNIYGKTPLHFAVQKGYTSLCLLLIQHGADLDAKDSRLPCF